MASTALALFRSWRRSDLGSLLKGEAMGLEDVKIGKIAVMISMYASARATSKQVCGS